MERQPFGRKYEKRSTFARKYEERSTKYEKSPLSSYFVLRSSYFALHTTASVE
jgi:hypothetical protein